MLLALLQSVSDPAAQDIDSGEGDPVDRHPQHVALGLVPAVLLDAQPSRDDADHQGKIDQRRDQGEADLEQPSLRDADIGQTFGLACSQDRAVLPQALQCAERPAEALLGQGREALGCFGPGDGRNIIADPPALALDGDGQVLIFGERVSSPWATNTPWVWALSIRTCASIK